MRKIPTYDQWLVESSGDIYKPKRGKPVLIDPKKYPELAGEFFNLISIAYAEIGGHSKIQSPDDVFTDPNWSYWEGTDIHGTSDFDIIMFGSKTRYGVKFAGVGHDGERDSKKFYIEAKAKDLMKPGYYIEVSGKLAEILIHKYEVPIVENENDVKLVLGKPIKWIGEIQGQSGKGWYERPIGGHMHTKILLGNPKV